MQQSLGLFPAPETLQNWGLGTGMTTQPSLNMDPSTTSTNILLGSIWSHVVWETRACTGMLWTVNLVLRLNSKWPSWYSSVYFKFVALQIYMVSIWHALIDSMFYYGIIVTYFRVSNRCHSGLCLIGKTPNWFKGLTAMTVLIPLLYFW